MPVTFTTSLPAPSNVDTDRPSGDQIDVWWSDNSDNENGFEVFYSSDGGSSWTQANGDLAPGTTSYSITNLSSGTTYDIRVDVFTEHVTSQSGTVTSNSLSDFTRSVTTYTSSVDMTATRNVSLSRDISHHVETIRASVTTDRTSLELIDFDVTWDEATASWYTDWFQEDFILGTEDTAAVMGYVVDDAKEPTATVRVEYDGTGNGVPDARSNEVRVDREERPREIEGVPFDEDGWYRLVISQYSGYNSLTTLNFGFVH